MATQKKTKIKTTKVFAIMDKAVQDGYSIITAQGGSRSGKTYNILIWLLYYALSHRVTISIVRKTLPALKRSVLRDFKEILYQFGVAFIENKSELSYTLQNGAFIEFFSTDDEQKIRGSKRDILFINEANELLPLEYTQLKMRTTTLAVCDYNPSFSDDHWLCELDRDERTFHFVTTYKDNAFLDQTIIDEIERLQYTNQSLWQIYGLGQQAQVEGLIYPRFEIIDTMPDYLKHRAVGLDYGFTNDPTAVIDCGVYGDGIYLDELEYSTHLVTSDIIDVLRTKAKGRKAISEVDNRLIEEIHRAGIDIHKVKKGDIMTGVNYLQGLKIYVTKRSLNVQKELKNYTFRQDKEGRWLNEPIDRFNHALDAVRYYAITELMDNAGIFRTRARVLRD